MITETDKCLKLVLVEKAWSFLKQFYGKSGEKDDVKVIERLKYPEVTEHNLAGLVRPTMYTVGKACKGNAKWMSDAMINVADHWCGKCTDCASFWGGNARCQRCPGAHEKFYEQGSETHIAVKAWLTSRFSEKLCLSLRWADSNYCVETFHSFRLRWLPKRFHFPKTHRARVLMAVMDWNENANREIHRVYVRTKISKSSFRTRAGTTRRLVEKTREWKKEIAHLMGISYVV